MNDAFIVAHFSFDTLYSLELLFLKYSKFIFSKLFSVPEIEIIFFFFSATYINMKITFNLELYAKKSFLHSHCQPFFSFASF